MSLVIILILSLLCSFEMIEASHNYQIQNDVNVIPNIGASCIIQRMSKENHIFCLASCNKNQECLSTIYIESETNNNCILYKKYFDITDTTISSNTKLFRKESKKK